MLWDRSKPQPLEGSAARRKVPGSRRARPPRRRRRRGGSRIATKSYSPEAAKGLGFADAAHLDEPGSCHRWPLIEGLCAPAEAAAQRRGGLRHRQCPQTGESGALPEHVGQARDDLSKAVRADRRRHSPCSIRRHAADHDGLSVWCLRTCFSSGRWSQCTADCQARPLTKTRLAVTKDLLTALPSGCPS